MAFCSDRAGFMTDGFKYIVRRLAAFDGWGFFFIAWHIYGVYFLFFYFLRRERGSRDEMDV